MATIDNSEMQVFTYFTHWSRRGTHVLMRLGRKWIYGGQPIFISKDACRAWPKTAKNPRWPPAAF